MASTDAPRRARSLGAARSLAVLLLLVLPACGEGEGGSGPTPGPVPAGAFELREVLEVVPSTAPGFDALEITCIERGGTSSPDCLDPATAQGQEVVLLDAQGAAKYRLAPATITRSDVASGSAVELDPGSASGWGVNVELGPAGTQALTELTKDLVGKKIAIVVDGVVLAAPTVAEPITTGAVQVNALTRSDAEALAASLAPRS